MRCPTLRDLPPPPAGKTGWPWTEESTPLATRPPGDLAWPRITVVTPSYNQGDFLEATLRSVLLQGYPDLEYLVLDGGSTDDSVGIIEKYAPWLSYWVSEPDGGQSTAINRGLRRGTGQFATWINSDDMLCRDALATHAARVGFTPNTVYVGECLYIDAEARTRTSHRARVHSFEDLVRIKTVWRARGDRGHIVQPEVLFPRQLALDVGGLDPDNHRTMDFDLWGKLLLAGARFHYTGIPIGMFRVHPQQKTRDSWPQTQSLVATAARLVARAEGLPAPVRQRLLVDLRAYEREYWRRTGLLARVGLPPSLVVRLRALLARVRRRGTRVGEAPVTRAGISAPRSRVRSILMTCRNDGGTGGVQVVFRNLTRALEESGRTVHLLYPASVTDVRLAQRPNGWGHPAYFAPLPPLAGDRLLLSLPIFLASLPLSLFHLVRLIRRHSVDVVNCHYLGQYFIHFVLAARLLRVPVVVSVHGADLDRHALATRMQRLALRLVIRGAHRVVACSRALARQTEETFPAAAGKVTHVHNGLVLADLARHGSITATPRPFVLCVCRQVDKKGTDTLLRAFALIAPEFPRVSLVIIGDGPALEGNRALARALGIERRVQFLGDIPRAQVLDFFATCDLFVVPSRAEPFGLVLLEAAYFEKPIVCTRVGGMPEIITDDVDGFVVEPDDPAAMAARMATLLRTPELAARFGARAHRKLLTEFLWEDRMKDYVAIYEELIAGGAGAPGDPSLTSAVALRRGR